MEIWTREDGRWQTIDPDGADLFGPAVIVRYGGAKVARVKTYPVQPGEGWKVAERLGKRRLAHGYVLTSSALSAA